ncbi:hypothetical protein MACH24_15290 [Erythrobacter sp. Dej080120_24]|nr:hypothetical protein MACH24_15290 [Erythrobacter sp. Dej080120_24]
MPILEPVALTLRPHSIAKTATFGPIDPAFVTPVGLVKAAGVATVDPAVALFEVAFAPAFDPIGPTIPALFDRIRAALAAAVHLLCRAIASLLLKAVRAPITPVFDLVGTAFAPAINLLGALFEPAFLADRAGVWFRRAVAALLEAAISARRGAGVLIVAVGPTFRTAILPVLLKRAACLCRGCGLDGFGRCDESQCQCKGGQRTAPEEQGYVHELPPELPPHHSRRDCYVLIHRF